MPPKPRSHTDPSIQYEIVEHTADWSLRVYGADLRQLLVNAARGMSYLLVDDLDSLPDEHKRKLMLEAPDAETLLVDWLSELAYWAEEEQLVFREFILEEVSETHLSAVMRGGRAQELARHIKAVTYHQLEIIESDQGLEVTIVFDV
jgi:SHS2 domain-containing protein